MKLFIELLALLLITVGLLLLVLGVATAADAVVTNDLWRISFHYKLGIGMSGVGAFAGLVGIYLWKNEHRP